MRPQSLRWRFPKAYYALVARCQTEGVQAYDITAVVGFLRPGESTLTITVGQKSERWEKACLNADLEQVTDPIIRFFDNVAGKARKVISEAYLIEMTHRQV
ncbi:MAG: hypothetical protein M1596_01250 [Firmicutes bacterium]|jgi:hypothetical protein|nr:hypothetical protein [Bacillota bacterium]